MSLWQHAQPHLRDLVAYEPGKPIEDVARELGLRPEQIIKLASNENPLGPSPKAVRAMHETLERAHFYPDGGGFYLREAIAKKYGLKIENVILGNGSNEIIEFIGHAFLSPGDEVITAKHAFVVYKLMATLFGAKTIEVDDPNFAHDLDAMVAAITPRTNELFIANPNNPTGTIVSQEEIDAFMTGVPDHVIGRVRRGLLRVPRSSARHAQVRARGPECRGPAHVLEDPGARESAHRLRPRRARS